MSRDISSGSRPRPRESRHDVSMEAMAGFPLDRPDDHGATDDLTVPDPLAAIAPRSGGRVRARGKFLYDENGKLYLKGATYGTFRPGPDGSDYPDQPVVEADFAGMAALGLNTVRTYTVPPARVLDAAARHGLRVLVGLPWEQHVAFLDDPGRARDIERRVRADVAACAGHPAVLGYAIGNEIPAPIVRWHGAQRTERFLERLWRAATEEDPEALVTYVNYPSTEYLHLPFLDFVCFNVYLERQADLRKYLARLQHVAGDRPLVLAEMGLDSMRNGEAGQSRSLDWQIRTTFAGGAAGAYVFAWTDEWHRGGHEVTDWDFGLVDRGREPKPAAAAVQRSFRDVPFPARVTWPRVSVVVCSYNGSRTIRDTMEGLAALEYPDYEVIVVDDGSIDHMAAIVEEYEDDPRLELTLHRTANRGLSAARNLGCETATGEIVAYIDDDAWPDPQWLTYLAASFMSTPHSAMGGPNVTPHEDGAVAACVANSPGGPIHVLVSDLEAEHVPGCNMAFRTDALRGIGGFDPRFRAAGDDVDACWRIQDAGMTLGFSPAAMVWHHRRPSLRAYWRQQIGYGKAEALLEEKWPERYNRTGHLRWSGRLYNNGHIASWRRGRIYQGVWGSAPFQSLYQPGPGLLWSLPAMPEWYMGLACLAVLSALGALWAPLLLALPLLVLGLVPPAAQAVLGGVRASFPGRRLSWWRSLRLRSLVALLHAAQPLARLRGRIRHGLVPWRRRRSVHFALPVPDRMESWSETWTDPARRLHDLENELRRLGALVLSGGAYDPWDMEVRYGTLGTSRIRAVVEEHGSGRQLVRLLARPRPSRVAAGVVGVFGALAIVAAADGAVAAGLALLVPALVVLVATVRDCGTATAAVRRAFTAATAESDPRSTS